MTETTAALRPFLETKEEFVEIRRDLHRHPELAFEEHRTSDIVARKLGACGLEVERGLGGTGVVGVLKAGDSDRAIGLRADMDALPLHEANEFDHRSRHDGKMHACGHDGHTAMLLAAAAELARTRNFDGVVYFIFQPAEENEGGARRMVEEGLFEKFPMEAVYSMHNLPAMPLGAFVAQAGPLMAGFDVFTATVRAAGGHAGMPHQTSDCVLAAAHAVTALQSVVSRNVDPLKSAVLSVTRFNAGHSFNVIPAEATICGTVRYLDRAVRDQVEARMAKIIAGLGDAFEVETDLAYEHRYPPTVNDPAEAAFCADVLTEAFGADCLMREADPLMGSEDFAFMLERKAGCYIWAGAAAPGERAAPLHNPYYDFNDDLLPFGAAYWSRLVEKRLPRG